MLCRRCPRITLCPRCTGFAYRAILLSRAIEELEYDFCAQLVERPTRSTRLTWAGQAVLEDTRRIFGALDLPPVNAAAANGYHLYAAHRRSRWHRPSRLAALSVPCRPRSRKWRLVCSRYRSCSRSGAIRRSLRSSCLSRARWGVVCRAKRNESHFDPRSLRLAKSVIESEIRTPKAADHHRLKSVGQRPLRNTNHPTNRRKMTYAR